jgi:hypothetical protein
MTHPTRIYTTDGWVDIGLSPPIPLVAALPTSPVDGEEVYFQDATLAPEGIIWHLRYKDVATYPGFHWEYVGGSRWESPDYANRSAFNTANITSYIDLSNSGISYTIPRHGVYCYGFHSILYPNAVGGQFHITPGRNGAAWTNNHLRIGGSGTPSGMHFAISMDHWIGAVDAGDVLTMLGATNAISWNFAVYRTRMTVIPRAVN